MTTEAKVVYVLMACHNRRPLTLRAIEGVLRAAEIAELGAIIVLFDDGSTDGTAGEVANRFPATTIISGDGSAFWAKSMSLAESFVLQELNPRDTDLIMWLNDDVDLLDRSLAVLRTTLDGFPESVVVGAVSDPLTGGTTYSGFLRYGRHALHLSKVSPCDEARPVDSLNGNVVLLPVTIARKLGGIDGDYSHAWADLDYGFRCRRSGVPVLLAPGFVGTCSLNPAKEQRDILTDWRSFIGPKGAGNFRSLAKILRVASPNFWLPQWISTYTLWWLRQVSTRALGKFARGDQKRAPVSSHALNHDANSGRAE